MNLSIDHIESAIGILRITANEKGITTIGKVEKHEGKTSPNVHTSSAKKQLIRYFDGNLREFDLPLDLEEGSVFYRKVWQLLLEIPYGRTTSYLEIARKLGDVKAVRAVGLANGRNPIAIIIPCHRVIGSDGSLTGYAHGIEAKRQLLALENPAEYAINGKLF